MFTIRSGIAAAVLLAIAAFILAPRASPVIEPAREIVAVERPAPAPPRLPDVPADLPPPDFSGLSLEDAAVASSLRVVVLGEKPVVDRLALFEMDAPYSFAGDLSVGTPVETPPWFVQLGILSPGTGQFEGNTFTEHCGGLLVHPRIVATVAHCFLGRDGVKSAATNVIARVGPSIRDDPMAHMQETRVIGIFDDFEGTVSNYRGDMALLLLDRPAPVANVIGEAAWASLSRVREGQIVCALGMGLDRDNNLLSRVHSKRFEIDRVGSATIGLSPTFDEAFRPGDSGTPGALCDERGVFADPLRIVGFNSSFSGEDRGYIGTLTAAPRLWIWARTAIPLLLKAGQAITTSASAGQTAGR